MAENVVTGADMLSQQGSIMLRWRRGQNIRLEFGLLFSDFFDDGAVGGRVDSNTTGYGAGLSVRW
jgi:hypothetical protein